MFKYLSSGLGALLVLSNVGWYVGYQAIDHKLTREKWAHSETVLRYENAQHEAEVASYKKVLEEERKRAEEARKADEAYSALLNKYNASIVRYQAAQRSSGTINLSSTSTVADGDYERSENTTISITIEDAGICAENTARLESIHQWAKTLNN